MSEIPVTIHTVGFGGHAGHIGIDLCMTGNAVGIDHIACGLARRGGNILALNVAEKIYDARLSLEWYLE